MSSIPNKHPPLSPRQGLQTANEPKPGSYANVGMASPHATAPLPVWPQSATPEAKPRPSAPQPPSPTMGAHAVATARKAQIAELRQVCASASLLRATDAITDNEIAALPRLRSLLSEFFPEEHLANGRALLAHIAERSDEIGDKPKTLDQARFKDLLDKIASVKVNVWSRLLDPAATRRNTVVADMEANHPLADLHGIHLRLAQPAVDVLTSPKGVAGEIPPDTLNKHRSQLVAVFGDDAVTAQGLQKAVSAARTTLPKMIDTLDKKRLEALLDSVENVGSSWSKILGGPPWKSTVNETTIYPLMGPTGQPRVMALRQGHIGDCWWLSTLMSHAQRDPSFIANKLSDKGGGMIEVKDLHHPWTCALLPPMTFDLRKEAAALALQVVPMVDGLEPWVAAMQVACHKVMQQNPVTYGGRVYNSSHWGIVPFADRILTGSKDHSLLRFLNQPSGDVFQRVRTALIQQRPVRVGWATDEGKHFLSVTEHRYAGGGHPAQLGLRNPDNPEDIAWYDAGAFVRQFHEAVIGPSMAQA